MTRRVKLKSYPTGRKCDYRKQKQSQTPQSVLECVWVWVCVRVEIGVKTVSSASYL